PRDRDPGCDPGPMVGRGNRPAPLRRFTPLSRGRPGREHQRRPRGPRRVVLGLGPETSAGRPRGARGTRQGVPGVPAGVAEIRSRLDYVVAGGNFVPTCDMAISPIACSVGRPATLLLAGVLVVVSTFARHDLVAFGFIVTA